MECRDFCYWLQGYIELSGLDGLTSIQTDIIADHLKLVFDKQTPDRPIVYDDRVMQKIPIVPKPMEPFDPVSTPFIC